MLKIVLKNGTIVKWTSDEFTDHHYDGNALVIMRENVLVGLYNVNNIISVVYKA